VSRRQWKIIACRNCRLALLEFCKAKLFLGWKLFFPIVKFLLIDNLGVFAIGWDKEAENNM